MTMSDLRREDLRYWTGEKFASGNDPIMSSVSPAEFDKLARAEGYVKLDVDEIEHLGAELAEAHEQFVRMMAQRDECMAELAEMRQEHERMVDQLHETFGLYAEARDKLADLRASSVVVRRKCETCEGRGYLWAQDTNLGEPRQEQCPDCDNGWQLAEGVEHFEGASLGDGYWLPARLLDGEDT